MPEEIVIESSFGEQPTDKKEIHLASLEVISKLSTLIENSGKLWPEVTVFLISGSSGCTDARYHNRRRLTAKMSRNFLRIIEDLYSNVLEPKLTREASEAYILKAFTSNALFSIRRAISIEDAQAFTRGCFREGCITVNIWLYNGVYLLAGQIS
jgi:hypothetical protein